MLSLRKCLRDVLNFVKSAPQISVGTNYAQIGKLLMQWRRFEITSTGADINTGRNYGTKTVAFVRPYSAAPKVLLGQESLSNYLMSAGVQSVTATNMVALITHTRGASTSMECDWLAIGEAK